MAAITRIEVANFLCDGYEAGKNWVPLYRGETLRLAGVDGFGSSTAIQVENAGGKTSLSESCLYLLTQHKELKPRVAARVAPVECGWTHIRIEFTERPLDEDLAQKDLIVISQQDVAGTPYVIGLTWSRGKDPLFYRYQGVLEDAPCYRKEGAQLALIDNESFKASVRAMPKSKWDLWRNRSEWQQEIKFFCDIEVLKQNAQFQLDGAGDYSAVFNKVNNKNGEGYDVNFFRQIVAPELLRDPLGSEGGDADVMFENALLNHLKTAVDRLLDISAREHELEAAEGALIKFEPVEQKAQDVVAADQEYKRELESVAQDGAVILALMRRNLPGLPSIAGAAPYAGNKRLMEALSYLVITQREGVVITDEGLSRLSGVEVSRINQYARERSINHLTAVAQPIELKDVLKADGHQESGPAEFEKSTQLLESKDVLKRDGRGGRRYGAVMYGLAGAQAVLKAVSNLSTATKIDGLSDILIRAFGIAIDEIDTNPYRHEQRRLLQGIKKTQGGLEKAKDEEKHWDAQYKTLLREGRDAKENEVAYETFKSRADAFQPEHTEDPLAAKEWAAAQLLEARAALKRHYQKVVELTEDHKNWSTVDKECAGVPLEVVLGGLIEQHQSAKFQQEKTEAALSSAQQQKEQRAHDHQVKSKDLNELTKQRDRLAGLAANMSDYAGLFGDVAPDTLDPVNDFQEANHVLQEKTSTLQRAVAVKERFDGLKPSVKIYRDIFRDADPATVNPTKDWQDHQEKLRIEEAIISDHQPFVEALHAFADNHPNLSPDEWLKEAEKTRLELEAQRRGNTRRVQEIDRELGELTTANMADDRVYSVAISTLKEAGVRFEKLNPLLLTAPIDRRTALLTLFSSALSAPVVETLEEADKATDLLERNKVTVPVFLKGPLLEFIANGQYTTKGKLTHSFLVGRRTRQVEILLNPALIREEKERLSAERVTLVEANRKLDKLLLDLQPTSDKMSQALKASTAVARKSEQKLREAESAHNELSAQSPILQRRASPAAISAVDAMKAYLAMGGDQAFNTLVASTIPQIEKDKIDQERRIAQLKPLISEAAMRCLHAAKDYKHAGGDGALQGLTDLIAELQPIVDRLTNEIAELAAAIDKVLVPAATEAERILRELDKQFDVKKRALESAIRFERTDDLDYMRKHKSTEVELDSNVTVASTRTDGIDFDRAAEYIRTNKPEARGFAERLAEAERNREKATRQIEALGAALAQENGRLSEIMPFVGDLHDAAMEIYAQYGKMAVLPADVRLRMSAIQEVHPEILEYADEVKGACAGEMASTTMAAKAAIANLITSIRALEIDTRSLTTAIDRKRIATEAFKTKREEFCDKARSGEIKGLQLPEIEAIASARSIDELMTIHRVKEKISSSIQEHRNQVTALRRTMEEAKAATIDSMTRFASQAEANLGILDRVMRKTPNARFFVEAEVASQEKIRQIIDSLIDEIQDREKLVRERGGVALNEDIEKRNAEYRDKIHKKIYRYLFSNPAVFFQHSAIREGDKTRLTGEGEGLSGGQRTALMMMWLIKQADYALTRAILSEPGNARDQKAKMRAAQRIMFFDGLFSNLSSDEIINHAFQGLTDVNDNFQLIGLIHNPDYVNNKDIFPVHLVGRKYAATNRNGVQHRFMSIETPSNKINFFQSAYRNNKPTDDPHARH